MSRFCNDLKTGQAAEKKIKDLFSECGLSCLTNTADLTSHDFSFELSGKKYLVEVKFDKWQHKSGNIAIEFYNPKLAKASGIMATKSHLWCVVLMNGEAWAANTCELREHYLTKPGLRDVLAGGDGNASFRLYRDSDVFGTLFLKLEKHNLLEVLNELLD